MRWVSALIWAATLAFFAVAFALQDRASWPEGATGPIWGEVAILAATQAAGGAIAGYLLATLFGRRGVIGWVVATVGAIVVCLLGGLLGGALFGLREMIGGGNELIQGLIRLGLGPLNAPLAIAETPSLAAVLAAATGLAHLMIQRVRTNTGP